MQRVELAHSGLSPRVRGNRRHRDAHRPRRGSIPASAGEPELVSGAVVFHRVYPRECGGTAMTCSGVRLRRGLSPRVRGNRGLQHQSARELGSIPASAGEPANAWMSIRGTRVYPRECGGTSFVVSGEGAVAGLSPRVRGNPAGGAGHAPERRSIPASAGEPSSLAMPSIAWRVYPRECGGTSAQASCLFLVAGLSPRVRGNLASLPQGVNPKGSIPASAGEPV